MTESEQLLAVEEIKQLKARYFRCMDTKDWAGFEAVFAPDATVDYTPPGGNSADCHNETTDSSFVQFRSRAPLLRRFLITATAG